MLLQLQNSGTWAYRIQDIVQYLQWNNPTTQLILMGILPRTDGEALNAGVYQWPNKFTEGVAAVNSGLKAYASPQHNVHYLDCTDTLFPDGKVCHSSFADDHNCICKLLGGRLCCEQCMKAACWNDAGYKERLLSVSPAMLQLGSCLSPTHRGSPGMLADA